jgi:putative flippase GtrA
MKHHEYIYRFVIVGVIGFVFNSAILVGLTKYVGLGKIPSEVIAMILALQLTFALHDNWTYTLHKNASGVYALALRKRYISYLMSNSFGSLMTIVLFGVFSWLLPGLVALAAAAVISMTWNFAMNKLLIWRRPKHQLMKEPLG